MAQVSGAFLPVLASRPAVKYTMYVVPAVSDPPCLLAPRCCLAAAFAATAAVGSFKTHRHRLPVACPLSVVAYSAGTAGTGCTLRGRRRAAAAEVEVVHVLGVSGGIFVSATTTPQGGTKGTKLFLYRPDSRKPRSCI